MQENKTEVKKQMKKIADYIKRTLIVLAVITALGLITTLIEGVTL